MSSLRDQLLAKGLTDKQSVKNVHKQKKNKVKQPKKERGDLSDSAKQAEAARLAKKEHDKELNLKQQRSAEAKAIKAQVKQLILASKLDREDADIAYSFTYQKKVKKIYVTAEQQKQLAKGQVSIVVLMDDKFELVPKIVADKVNQRTSDYVIENALAADTIQDEDDPYAEYQIPDDLVW